MVAMAGKNCVAIATDTRLSTELMTIDGNFQRVFKVNDKVLMGLSGLGTDVQTFNALMKFKTNLYKRICHKNDQNKNVFIGQNP